MSASPAPHSGRRRAFARRLAALVAVLALLGAACGGSDSGDQASPTNGTAGTSATDTSTADAATPGDDGLVWPVPDWATTTPEAAGFDPDALNQLADAAEAASSNCLIVTRDGELVGEWYWNGTDAETRQEAFSVTKSITSALVGLAVDRELLDVDDPASTWIEPWRGTPSETVTVFNLLANDSGRYWDFVTDYLELTVGTEDKTGFAISLDQAEEPGTTWVYNNAAIQTLDAVISGATGTSTADFARTELFEPIGMGSELTVDPTGNTLTFMGVQASCRDLARFGLLFARDGVWDGEQIISQEWVRESTEPSTELTSAYGYLWWLNRDGVLPSLDGTGEPVDADGRMVPGAPASLFMALGFGNQTVAVLPDEGIVAVRLGPVNTPEGVPAFRPRELVTGVLEAFEG